MYIWDVFIKDGSGRRFLGQVAGDTYDEVIEKAARNFNCREYELIVARL